MPRPAGVVILIVLLLPVVPLGFGTAGDDTRAGALPFADNPDPTQCGIPTPWVGEQQAWVSGIWQGELIAPVVELYDSHLRREVLGRLPHGAPVEIELSQANPVLDYFRVRSVGIDPPISGWVPAPFVSFSPPPVD